jgi:hypothetical protein
MTKEEIAAVLAEHKKWIGGTDGQRADLTGANLTCTNLTGANLTGANLTGAKLRGAKLRGAEINDKTAIAIMRRATRSDGYEFFLWRCESGYFVQAGCRWLSFSAARKHWRSNTWRKDDAPDLYHESLDILAFFERHIKREQLATPKESEATASKESEATASKES